MISIIVKVDRNNLIGDSTINRMPRESSSDPYIIQANREDMKYFVTVRKSPIQAPVIIMGRKTRDSIPEQYKPLDYAHNCIISRTQHTTQYNISTHSTIEDALHFAHQYYPDREVFVIGGGQIYTHILEHNFVDQIYLTRLDAEFMGDIYFPVLGDDRNCVEQIDRPLLQFCTYVRQS